MLPFLKPKRTAEAIISHRPKVPGEQPVEHSESEHHPDLMKHAKDLHDGVHESDHGKIAGALKGAHEHLMKHGATPHAPTEVKE